jgi:hypothetical protein
MRWSGVDGHIWTIPTKRYKTGMIPLSRAALDLRSGHTKIGRNGFIDRKSGIRGMLSHVMPQRAYCEAAGRAWPCRQRSRYRTMAGLFGCARYGPCRGPKT